MEARNLPAKARACVRVLGSGSSGNSVFVRLGEARFLIDVGLPLKRIRAALAELDEEIESLDAVLLTHEHSDHIAGLGPLCNASPEIRVFATEGTALGWSRRKVVVDTHELLVRNWPTEIKGVQIMPFSTSHDARQPVGFRLELEDFAMALATDLGKATAEVRHALFDCQLLLLEANHDVEMLREGPYPARLKRRIASTNGHLSNDQTRRLLRAVAGPRLERVALLHISAENNTPELAIEAVEPALADFQSVVLTATAQEVAGPVWRFNPSAPTGRPSPPPRPMRQAALPF